MANPDGVVLAADVRAADALLDALASEEAQTWTRQEARGVFAAHLADVRTAGYLEGEATGRRQAGNLIREALRAEGL